MPASGERMPEAVAPNDAVTLFPGAERDVHLRKIEGAIR
jgi:hypothetical protein